MAVDIRTHAQLGAQNALPLPAEEEALYTQLLRIRDAVISGKHPQFKLPPAVIAQLRACDPAAGSVHAAAAFNGSLNGTAFNANGTTNYTQPSPAYGLPGLQAASSAHVNGAAQQFAARPSQSSGLDPIFLEKSDSLVRAEGQLKRQRIERDLQAQVEQRKQSSQTRDYGVDAPSSLNISAVLATAFTREPHVSGLKEATKPGSAASSSFDENDYYSSQVESDWSSPESASKQSDRAAGAHSAALGHNGEPSVSSSYIAKPLASGKQPAVARDAPQASNDHLPVNPDQSQETFDEDDEDDEYVPQDTNEFGALANATGMDDDDDDDNSEYEPGEITQDSIAPTPYHQTQQPAHSSPHVPIIRNHLTHIAAPQPNRVSPLAVAKGPSIELELVNGRPEIVHKSRPVQNVVPSRVSTASPSGNGAGGSGKKRRQKKRKRDSEPSSKTKKKRDRHNNARSPPSPAHLEPYIKPEPVSPPPFANVPDVPQFAQRQSTYRPAEIDLISPRHVPQIQYMEPPRSGLRYEYAQPTSPAILTPASPSAYRPVQRDSQDLRRVASLQYAQRPPSPAQPVNSPTPYRTVSMTYGDPRLAQTPGAASQIQQPRYQEQPAVQYVRAERSRSPPRLQEFQPPSSGRMPPPSAPPRQIVVDQYGNRYYAADAAPPPAPSRASVAPVDRRQPAEIGYERAPSRMASMYSQPPPQQYEPAPEVRMAPPPPPPSRRDEHVQYVNAHGYPVREYSTRPVEPQQQQIRYIDAPTSPVYQAMPGYEQMGPPPPPAREQTSPVYVPRSYSVRPEDPVQAAAAYVRQASVAPPQYARQASVAPVQYGRQASVAPVQYVRQESAAAPPPVSRAYSHAPPPPPPPPMRYVDQYGREVYPSQALQQAPPAPEYRY